jgi:hypothetical protein
MKKPQILIAHQKDRIDWTKKVSLAAKKVLLGTRGFCTYFCAVDHPLYDVLMKKTQIVIAH